MIGRRRERAPRSVVYGFLLATAGGVAFACSYTFNLGALVLGSCLGVAFAAMAFALIRWSKLIDQQEPEYVEERAVSPSPPAEWEHFTEALTEQPVPRSKVLWGMFGFSLSVVGLAALFPTRSLLPDQTANPDAVLSHTQWKHGVYLVDDKGLRVLLDDLDFGGVTTVTAEGSDPDIPHDAALLFRIHPESLRLPDHRIQQTVDGAVAFSKLCTHAGCPVGLYADDQQLLLCPCHHSIFDVLEGAQPVSGPAPRPLPQLPLGLDKDGYLIATGDFDSPVGPGWWGYYK